MYIKINIGAIGLTHLGHESWDTSERRSKIPGKFRNAVLEKISLTDRPRNEE
jgi:hypothetical protein